MGPRRRGFSAIHTCRVNELLWNHNAEDDMIEILTNCPDNVVAAPAHGVVTKRDYEDTLVPRVELASSDIQKSAATTTLGRNCSKWNPAPCGRILK